MQQGLRLKKAKTTQEVEDEKEERGGGGCGRTREGGASKYVRKRGGKEVRK